jgi:hypothetical protein
MADETRIEASDGVHVIECLRTRRSSHRSSTDSLQLLAYHAAVARHGVDKPEPREIRHRGMS